MLELGEYCKGLDASHKARYIEKIRVISEDPYLIEIEDCSTDLALFPVILYPDICSYLIETKSAYTKQEMKAYKSLEAYNQAVCGWVKKVVVKSYPYNVLILAKVWHSQRLNEKPLSPWIIAKKDGEILSAHCDCVAGLTEVCTHVAAVLFAIDMQMQKFTEPTRTGVPAYWMQSGNKAVAPAKIANIDFSSPRKKLCVEETLFLPAKNECSIPTMTKTEKENFLHKIMQQSSRGSVIHLVTKPFAGQIQCDIEKKKESMIMTCYEEKYGTLTLEKLQEISGRLDLQISLEECKRIERETKTQSKSKAWFAYRAGRITASNFKRSCRTDIKKPSVSLIKNICYPSTYKLKVRALEYGCIHEKDAVKEFIKIMAEKHLNLEVERGGFFINPKYPYFGASPDGIVTCNCCGFSLLEVKCPYCARHSGVEDIMDKKGFFMRVKNGEIIVDQDHSYYYQVQMQLALTGLKKCYLVAWSQKKTIYTEVDFNDHFWKCESEKAKNFFFKVVLPEALGKYFTKTALQTNTESDVGEETEWAHLMDLCEIESDEENSPVVAQSSPSQSKPSTSKASIYCICERPDDLMTPMIGCESGFCKIEWYHLPCIGMTITTMPPSPWICNFCRESK